MTTSEPCPFCGGGIPNDTHRGEYPGAMSRRIPGLEICSDCGTAEAMNDYWSAQLVTKIFTFGTNHVDPLGRSRGGAYVSVTAPDWADHRAIFMSWLGSNRFSHEYDAADSETQEMITTYRLRAETQITVLVSD